MAKLLKLRRGTTSQHASFTGAEGEVTIDTTKDTAVVHDGAQAGGRPLAREDMTNVSSASIAGQLGTDSIATTKIAGGALPTDVTVTNANVVSNAAIAGTKISPNFGSQNISTTGNISVSGTNLNMSTAYIDFSGSLSSAPTTAAAIYRPADNSLAVSTGNSQRLLVNNSGASVTGNIAVSGTVDGRDVAADGSKLDGIDSGAKDDQTKAEIDALNINADQVDGLHASSFIRSDANDSASGSYSFTNSYNEFGDGTGSVSNDGGWNARVNIAGSNHGRLDVKSVSDGIIATMSAHNGHGKAYMGTRSSGHSLGLYSGGSERATLSTAGSLSTTVQGTLWGASNDGSGSGLDADTVDGKHKTDFLQKGTSNSSSHYNGDSWLEFSSNYGLYYPNNYAYHVYLDSNYLKLTNNTNTNGIAIFTNSSSRRGYVYADNGNNIGFLNTGGSWSLKCDNSGNVTATGNVTAYSDARLKTNVNTINDALSIVGKLRGVSFDWKESGERSIGVIAQEVEEVLPELVLTQEVTDGKTEDNPNPETKEIKSVDYGKIVGVLINAINELKAEVDELKGGK